MATVPLAFMEKILGVNGHQLWIYANGLDTSRVMHNEYNVPIKSIGHSTTTKRDLVSSEEVWRVILELSQNISKRLRENGLSANRIQISIKDNRLLYNEFQATLDFQTRCSVDLARAAHKLFNEHYGWENNIRAVGIRAIDLIPYCTEQQINLFFDYKKQDKAELIETTMEKIRARYGNNAIKMATLLLDLKIPEKGAELITMPSPMYH